jgi:hypothetical protein
MPDTLSFSPRFTSALYFDATLMPCRLRRRRFQPFSLLRLSLIFFADFQDYY